MTHIKKRITKQVENKWENMKKKKIFNVCVKYASFVEGVKKIQMIIKLDGVSPIDNRPSKLQHLVKKKQHTGDKESLDRCG